MCAAGLALAAAAPVALAPLGALPPRVRSAAMATDGDADVLRIFLRDEAHVHAKIIDRTLLQLEEQEVFNMEGMQTLAELPAFDACGFSAVTATLIRKALAARGDAHAAASSDVSVGKAPAAQHAAQTGAAPAMVTPPRAGRTRSVGLSTPSAPTRQLFAGSTPPSSPARDGCLLPTDVTSSVPAAEPVAATAGPISYNFGGPVEFAATGAGPRVKAAAAATAAKAGVEAAIEAAEAPWRTAAAEAAQHLSRLRWLEALVCYEVPPDFWARTADFWEERATAAAAEQQAELLADPMELMSAEQQAALDAEPGAYTRAQLVALDIAWLADVPEWMEVEARLEKARKQEFIARNGHAGRVSFGIPSHISRARGYGTGKGGSEGSGKGDSKGGGAEGSGRPASQHLKGNLSTGAHFGHSVPANASSLNAKAHVDVTDLSQGTPPFVLTSGDSPDARYPWKLRWDKWQWLTVELYDRWLRGGTLEAADFPEEDAFLIEQGEPQSEAARVTWLINRVPGSRAWMEGDMDIDASRPAASQLDAFVRMGWSKPPTACELVRRMVDGVKADYGRHRPLPGKGVYAHSQRDYFLEADSAEGSGAAGAPADMVAAYGDDADYGVHDGDAWDCDAECEAEDACAAYAAQAGEGGA